MAKASTTQLTVETLTKRQQQKLQRLSTADEYAATVGVLNIILACLLAVRFPEYYWVMYFLQTVILIPLRLVRFRRNKAELLLFDWCYMVTHASNICAILALLRVMFGLQTPLVEYNSVLIRAGFAMAMGPLAWSVFLFRNSLVFHDLDHSTSVFLHLSPNILMWCLRWGSGVPSKIHQYSSGMFKVCDSQDDFSSADT